MQLAVQTMTDVASSLELGRWAEAEGLAAFGVADHYLTSKSSTFALDQPTVLAAVAAGTETIELCTLVSPVTFRHPAVMLKTGVTLDEISGGRFTLGLGAAWMAEEHEAFGFEFPPARERFDRLEESMAFLLAGRSGRAEGFEGRHYRLAAGTSPEPRGETMKLMVGGSGPRRTPEIAGRYADEFNVYPSRHPLGSRIQTARRVAAVAGRDPDALVVSTAFPLVVGEDPNDLEARIAQIAATRGVDPDRIRERWPAVGIPVATPARYRDRLADLEEMGISRVYFQVAFDSFDDIRRMVRLLKT